MTRFQSAPFTVLCLLGAAWFTGAASAASGQKRPRVAVLDFQNETTWWENDLGGAAASLFTTRLVRAGDFSVIERDQLNAILDEQGLQHSGVVNPEQAMELGRIAGAHYIILGSISRFNIDRKKVGFRGMGADVTEAESALNVRVVSTETAEIVAAAEADGKKRLVSGSVAGATLKSSAVMSMDVAREALEPAFDKLIAQLHDQADRMVVFEVEVPLPAAEIVGLGSGGAIYINRGENADVRVGQRFAVMRVIDEIVDGDGNVLDRVTDQVAVLEVTRVLGRSSVCRLVEGEQPQEGDAIEALKGTSGS